MTQHPRIRLAPDVLAGKPVIRGTRLSVEFVIGLMVDGWSEADIVKNYPDVTPDDIIPCLSCARDTSSRRRSFRAQPDICASSLIRIFPAKRSRFFQVGGHDVVRVRLAARGASDPDVLAWAAREERFC